MLFYLFNLLIFINFNSIFMYWILLEMNLICFCLILYNFSSEMCFKEYDYILFYFIVQCLGSILILSSSYVFTNGMEFLSSMGLILGLILKMGIFPIYTWIMKLSVYLDSFSFTLLLTLQKFPLFIGLFFMEMNILFILILTNMFFGSIMLIFCESMKFLLVYSSIYSTIWFFILFLISNWLFLSFLLQYSVLVYMVLKSNDLFLVEGSSLFISMLFFMGLPPMSFFFFKIFSISSLFFFLNYFMLIIFWSCSFFSLVGYVKIFYSYSLMNMNIYQEIYKKQKNLIFIFFISFFTFFMGF